MTGLHRTKLTTPQKIECSAKAVAGQAIHGTISQLSDQFNISRPTVYNIQESAHRILEEHFEKPESAHRTIWVEVDENQLNRALVALRIVGANSLRNIEDLIPILYPGVKPCYGVIQRILSVAEENAKVFNTTTDLSEIHNGALDEMFSQGDPVLAGVDLDSGYLPILELRESRSGDDWCEVLDKGKLQGLDLKVVVKDAGTGMAAGVKKSFPDAEQRDDCFHVLYYMNKLRQQLRNNAYGAIEEEYQQQQKLDKMIKRNTEEEKIQKQKEVLPQAIDTAQRRIERYDTFEQAVLLIEESMEYVNLETGELYAGGDIENMMIEAAVILNSIEHKKCKKLATYILNRASGIALATQALNKELNALVPGYTTAQVSNVCRFIRLVEKLKKYNQFPSYKKQYKLLIALYALLMQEMGENFDQLLNRINTLLTKRYRASSAIEGFNATLRPYLYVHKGVTQNFLELFRAYYNLRIRRWGRHKGTSAHECITGNVVDDWLTKLGYPVSKQAALAA